MDADIIFRYQKVFFGTPKLIWDDTISCNITDGWMLTSPLDIQKCFLISPKSTKLFIDQKKDQIWYPNKWSLIVIFNSDNKLVWLLMSSILSLFYFRALEKSDSEVLEFSLFIELSILEWFLTWFFKHARIPVCTYFKSPIILWSSSWLFSSVCDF